MEIPITRSKISLPAHRADWITRPRLFELFYELLDFKLILITAPAGYGKTTLTADIAHDLDIPTCWFALDELDQDPLRFITHFIAAISIRFPGFGTLSQNELKNSKKINLDHLTTILANEIFEHIHDHFLLVLDDYYLVEHSVEIRQFISLFIQRTDENCHLALLTRKLPDLPDLTLLVGRTQVGGLSFRELAFNAEEIKEFIKQNYSEETNEEVTQNLFQQTEGWITGLLLSAQSRWVGAANQMRVAQASGIDLSAYLMAQVLNQQPEYLCKFLLQSSLLDEFDRNFCQEVLGDPPDGYTWQGLIQIVIKNNLFTQPLENGWVRYHHLFRDFLQAHIARNHPEDYNRILRKSAEVYARDRFWEKSRAIYLRLDDQPAIVRLIEQASQFLARESRFQTLATWIDALPPETSNSPNLISLRGIAAVMLGEVNEGIEQLNQAEALFRPTQDNKGYAQTLTRRGFAHLFRGQYQNAIDDAQKALELLGDTEPLTRAEAMRVMGMGFFRVGDIPPAANQLEHALEIYALNDPSLEAAVLNELGMLYRAHGRFNQAEDAYLRAYQIWKHNLDLFHAAIVANNLGVLFHFRGIYQQASLYLKEAISHAENTANASAQALAYSSLGDLYQDLSLPDAASGAYQEARQIARNLRDNFLLLYLDLVEAKLAHSQGGTAYALQLLENAANALEHRHSKYEKGLYEFILGQILISDQPERAILSLEKAHEYLVEGDHPNEIMLIHFYCALTYHKLRQRKKAVHHLWETMQRADSLEESSFLYIEVIKHQEALEDFKSEKRIKYQLQKMLHKIETFEPEIAKIRKELRRREMPIPVGPPKIVIQGLGTNRVSVDGNEITTSEWQTVRARDIFFFILEHPEGVIREKIETTYWPDASPSQLRFNFKKTMYRLRRAFDHDPILFNGDRYFFNHHKDYEYDVEELERALDQVQRASNEPEKIHALEMVVKLYRGVFLPQVEGQWAMEKREYLARRYLEAVLTLGQYAFDQKDYSAVLDYSQILFVIDPCMEEAHRLAMRAYAARGSRSDIVHQFNLCKKTLEKNYGFPPSKETFDLYRKLMQ